MDNQKKILNKITTAFVNACKRNLEINLQVNGEDGILDKILSAQLQGNMLDLEMLTIQLENLRKEYESNLTSVRQGVLTLELLDKQDFALN
jgi:uncharacterized protein YsxB (DUF464 family)